MGRPSAGVTPEYEYIIISNFQVDIAPSDSKHAKAEIDTSFFAFFAFLKHLSLKKS